MTEISPIKKMINEITLFENDEGSIKTTLKQWGSLLLLISAGLIPSAIILMALNRKTKTGRYITLILFLLTTILILAGGYKLINTPIGPQQIALPESLTYPINQHEGPMFALAPKSYVSQIFSGFSMIYSALLWPSGIMAAILINKNNSKNIKTIAACFFIFSIASNMWIEHAKKSITPDLHPPQTITWSGDESVNLALANPKKQKEMIDDIISRSGLQTESEYKKERHNEKSRAKIIFDSLLLKKDF